MSEAREYKQRAFSSSLFSSPQNYKSTAAIERRVSDTYRSQVFGSVSPSKAADLSFGTPVKTALPGPASKCFTPQKSKSRCNLAYQFDKIVSKVAADTESNIQRAAGVK